MAGAAHHESDSATTLLTGIGRTDITPPPDCVLDGFAARDHNAEGIHDNLSVTALALSSHGASAVIVGLDLLELTDEQIDLIHDKVQKKHGLAPDRIFLNCSHTHAGPMVQDRFNRKVCPESGIIHPDSAYIEKMIDGIVEAIDMAMNTLKPSIASFGQGETQIGICRRARDKSVYKGPSAGYIGIYANFPNPDKETDRTCPVMMFTDMNDKPIALLFGAACHPTTMSHPNYLVSAEFPGAARRILEDQFDGALSLFIQGIGGDVKPRQVAEETAFRSGDFDDVEAVGKELAGDVMNVLKNGMSRISIDIKSALKRFPLSFAPRTDRETFIKYDIPEQSEFRRTWAKLWLDKLDRGEEIPESKPLALSILQLSPELRFCGIAGELLTDIGLKIKRHFQSGITLPCGYTNGRIGYIPDSVVLKEGGYEATETVFFTNDMPAPWRDDIDETILDAFYDLSDSLR